MGELRKVWGSLNSTQRLKMNLLPTDRVHRVSNLGKELVSDPSHQLLENGQKHSFRLAKLNLKVSSCHSEYTLACQFSVSFVF